MRGIGPCYRDKVGRSWPIRLGDMYRDDFRAADRADRRGPRTQMFAGLGVRPIAAAARRRRDLSGSISRYAQRLRPYVADTTAYLLDAVEAGKRLLFEGAQGALLDIDHGTFPFVTSSNSSGVGVSSGLGRARPVHHQGDRRVEGLLRRGSAAGRFPPSRTTRSASTSATAATNTAPSPGGRGAAAGSTPWPPATRPG